MKNLEELTITHCGLKNLHSFPKLLSLKTLDLSHNELTTLEISKQATFRNLIYLNVKNNSLKLLSHDAFSFFPNLEEIHLQFNKIFSVDWEAFRLIKLRFLYLQNNYLPIISEHMLRFTPNLEVLDLSHNQLTFVQSSSFYTAQRLSSINLNNNRIQQFKYDSFMTLDQIRWLDLSFNNMSILPGLDLKQFIGLKYLNLSGNPFTKIISGDIWLPKLESSWSDVVEKNNAFLPFLTNTETHDEQHQQQSAVNHHPIHSSDSKPRIYATKEQLKFDIIMPEDAGNYKCTIGTNPSSPEKSVVINFAIKKPAISIKPVEIGSHFVTVSWNDTLKICAYNRVSSFLTVQDGEGYTRRYTRLSLHNPWLSYNVMRLKPLQGQRIQSTQMSILGPLMEEDGYMLEYENNAAL
uniref:Ig-like domain-containing protein n=1 Tax=Panagrolaimus sp. ES5 TaxID=591445 RepID=A0AC34GPY6_9BILA